MEILKFINSNNASKTADGDDLFKFTRDNFRIDHKITMSLVGGLMAKRLLWSPRIGVFQITPGTQILDSDSSGGK